MISITGLDGCGKSTQIDLLKKYLEKKGITTFISKAYTSDFKEMLASYLEYWDPATRMFFFLALDNQQCVEVIQAVKERKIVIADRWDESYMAYHLQFGILSRDKTLRKRLHGLVFKRIRPDITFLLDIPVEMVSKRTKSRRQDFFDKNPIEYHIKMRNGYLRLAKARNTMIIDGTQSIKTIHRMIIQEVRKLIFKE